MLLATGERIGPYEVLSRLGSGGMGDVYLARDPRLDRRVALKVLRPRHGAQGIDRTRLLREGRAAARIVHPRVAAVYDVVEAGDYAVLVLEYVEGRTLRRLMEGGPLPVAQAIDIAAQICDALEAAHAHGVVHGDIKPENVCLTASGHVKVLDFGIARVLPHADSSHGVTLTIDQAAPGAFAGTPRYAAPELFRGATPDARSDLYAAAAVLYEMLTGVPPHEGDSALDIGLKALSATVQRVDLLRPQVPRTLADTVARALTRDRRNRPPSAAAMATELRATTIPADATPDTPTLSLEDLVELPSAGAEAGTAVGGRLGGRALPSARFLPRRWLAVAVAAVAIAVLAWGGWRWFAPSPAATDRSPQVLAVLPLEAVGDLERSAALATGIADTLVADLAEEPGLLVVSRRASMSAAGGRGDLAGLARELGATLLVDGTVQAIDDSLRVSLTLVKPDGTVAWGQSVEGRVSQVFDLQRDLAGGLRRALQVHPARAREAGRDGRPQGPASLDIQALSDYTDAVKRLSRQDLAGNVALAIDGFSRALGRDPGFALAHVGLSDAYMADYRQTRSADALAKAVHHADQAASMAPYHAETWVALARIRKMTGRQAEASEALERAISLQPAHDEAWRELGLLRAEQGNRPGAEEALRRAIALRPGYWQNHHEFGRFLFESGQHAAAELEFKMVIEIQPDSPRGYQALGTVYQAQGRLTDAITNYERATQLSPSVNAYLNIGVLQHWEGRFRDAIASYERAVSLAPDDPVPPRNIGDSLLRLGEEAAARATYAKALGLTERELQRTPEAQDMRELRAVLLAKLGRHAEADRESSALTTASPGLDTALYTRAVVLALGGRLEQARATLDGAVAAGYPRALADRDDDLSNVSASGPGSKAPGQATGGRDR